MAQVERFMAHFWYRFGVLWDTQKSDYRYRNQKTTKKP